MMLRSKLYSQLVGTVLYGVDGVRVGQVRRVLVDEITGRPEWVAVSTGALGARQRLVPVMSADLKPGGIGVPYPAAVVLAAPRFDPRDTVPDQAAEEELYRHYGMDSEPPPARLSGPDQSADRPPVDDEAGGGGAVPTVVSSAGGSPAPDDSGWDLEKVRQLLEQVFSHPQRPRSATGEISTVHRGEPTTVDDGAEQDPRTAGGGPADDGR